MVLDIRANGNIFIVSGMLNKIQGQPDSYDKKCVNHPDGSMRPGT